MPDISFASQRKGASMIKRASVAILTLLAVAVSLPAGFAGAADTASAEKAQQLKTAQVKQAQLKQARAKQARALQVKKAKQQQLARQQQLAKAQQEQQKKKEWYADDRDRGLDIAAEYAPKTIAKIRKNNTIAKGDTVDTGNGKKGWQQYMNRYYSR